MQQIMGQMMNSPMMQNVMNDPEVLRNMLQGNPAIQQVHTLLPCLCDCLLGQGNYAHFHTALSLPAHRNAVKPSLCKSSICCDHMSRIISQVLLINLLDSNSAWLSAAYGQESGVCSASK